MNIFGYLESCRFRYHLQTADIWAGLMGRDANAYLSDGTIDRVAQAARERGLTVVNYHADGCHPWEDDADKRKANQALAERHIEAAEKLGARTVRIDTGGHERHWTSEQFDTLVAKYTTWSQRAKDNGYRIGPETHWGTDNFADNQLQLAKAVNSPGYGILLHMGKATDMPIDEWDRALAPFAMHTHLTQVTCETRLETAIQILLDANYQGCLGVEHHSAKNEYAEVAAQLGAVQRVRGNLLASDLSYADRFKGNPILGF